MIPKKIHYCWFGGNPLPELAKKCIESWKKFCPDYEIIEWNETNYDINQNTYMKQAYDNKKWGFVPDYVRLDVIYKYGGVYLDTDVEIIKPIDDLLELDAFAGVEQNSKFVALGLGFGACKENETIKAMRDYYDTLTFIKNGEIDYTPAPAINNIVLSNLGYVFSKKIVVCGNLTIFPSEYFCPLNYAKNKLKITNKTYTIHHYTASWYGESHKYSLKMKRRLGKFLPRKLAAVFATAFTKWKYEGFKACMKWIFKKR